jgi:hypothetical protein
LLKQEIHFLYFPTVNTPNALSKHSYENQVFRKKDAEKEAKTYELYNLDGRKTSNGSVQRYMGIEISLRHLLDKVMESEVATQKFVSK